MYDLAKKGMRYVKFIDCNLFENLKDIEKYEYLIKNNIFLLSFRDSPLEDMKFKIDISQEKFNKLSDLEKYNCLIRELRFVQNKDSLFTDSKNFKFSSDLGFTYKGYLFEINKEIKDEFYAYLHMVIENLNSKVDLKLLCSEIHFKVNVLFNTSQKLKYLKKLHSKYAKKFSKNPENRLYLNEEYDFYENWEHYVTDSFNEELFEYLTVGTEKLDFESGILNKWIKVYEAKSLMNYCETLINEIENPTINSTDCEAKKIKNYRENIFVSFKASEWYYKTLRAMSAIEANGKPRERMFQPVCNAIFKNQTCKKLIFKYRLQLKEYITFLNIEFEANIPNLTNLSDGASHENMVDERIKTYIQKETNNSE